jgi:peptidoglycan biosynthesis protein MviN/MurJ (putative lipid II flippase)
VLATRVFFSTQAIWSPTIISAIDRAVSALGSQWATTLPCRRIVAALQSAFTSSSLCEM